MSPFSDSLQEEDVLASVPQLPTLEQSVKATSASTLQRPAFQPPRIHLSILQSSVPSSILQGIQELVRHTPRKNMELDGNSGGLKLPQDEDTADEQTWWWNVM